MIARCRLLASQHQDLPPLVLRCPTGMTTFHYHGSDGSYYPLSGIRPCPHRHRTIDKARECSDTYLAQKEIADKQYASLPRRWTTRPVFHQ